jgi:hypothetical protein
MLSCYSVWGDNVHEISRNPPTLPITSSLTFPNNPPPRFVYLGEPLKIPLRLQLNFRSACNRWPWDFFRTPPGTNLEYVSGSCGTEYYMEIVFRTDSFRTISGKESFYVGGIYGIPTHLESPEFSTTIIPHPLSMNVIPQQSATAGVHFLYDFKPTAVAFYNENQMSGASVVGEMPQTDIDQLAKVGLQFHPDTLIIDGTPKKTDVLTLHVGAKNGYSTAAAIQFTLKIDANLEHTPVFKKHFSIASAAVAEKYTMDLMNLLEKTPGFGETNQISFSIVKDGLNAGWLKISDTNSMLLEGVAHKEDAGKEVQVKLMAHSNTGGNSDPITIYIPVAADPEQKPTLSYFEMEQLAGNQFLIDISNQIQDPANDSELKVIIDKIEPKVTWLNISSLNPKALEGVVPNLAIGQKYLITLHANTRTGGNSDSITVPLQINFDPRLTPQFKEDNPHLPMLFPGQPFIYNFVDSRDIFPEYDDAPYTIEFAENYEPPTWLKLQNNKLFSESLVPDDADSDIAVELIIKNIPGGSSDVVTLHLTVMN